MNLSTTTEASSIIDNRGQNTLLHSIQTMSDHGRELWIATAFFSLDALNLLADSIASFDRIRLLFGDDSSATERTELLNQMRSCSDGDLLDRREQEALLSPLRAVERLFAEGKVEARCYTREKFHAKAYIFSRDIYPTRLGIIGSGNFTRPGLTQNVELNVRLYEEQTAHLASWFDERWEEAVEDVVTDDVLQEIRRQIDLYDPYVIYLKALLTWGRYIQGQDGDVQQIGMYDTLDPHQQHAYHQALNVLDRNQGVMICDGVGLGKSFIALALMEKMCRQGENVLLLAPKNILDISWKPYLKQYLQRFRKPFGNIHEMPMTMLGFPPEGSEEEEDVLDSKVYERREEVRRLHERASVVVVDESHNFRSTSAARYQNLDLIAHPANGSRKKIILLTATPINNAFRDIAAQLAFISQNAGTIGGYTQQQIMRFANNLDKENSNSIEGPQGVLELMSKPEESLTQVLEQVVIQRSRTTCREQSSAAGRPIQFPHRRGPVVLEYSIREEAPELAEVLTLSEKRFRPLSYLLRKMKEAAKEVSGDLEMDASVLEKTTKAYKGIKLAAFLPEQYATRPKPGQKTYQDEVRLAGLVYANTLKQLESSMPAFQGILQSLGAGLIARLEYMLEEDARPLTEPHIGWVRTPIFGHFGDPAEIEEDPDILEDGEELDASGGEADEWVEKLIHTRKLRRKLAGYREGDFHLERWREDIVQDLGYLQEIHAAVLEARHHEDPKLEHILPSVREELEAGKRVLIFTQSQRTAEYIERVFLQRLDGWNVARIDSRVEKTRQAILHGFAPGYNPEPETPAPSVPRDVHVLVSTDVLSEGVNLQQAGAVFNWDIHWNPVRLIQRIGRVDRRLNTEITSPEHTFTIYNVFPPPEIEKIIKLVDAVEGRALNISRAVGIDLPFFTPDDPAGNLKEFNAYYEGETTDRDDALTDYISLTSGGQQKLIQRLDALPPGAFGVWRRAPYDGLFAMFVMEPTEEATEQDRDKFKAVIGRPILGIQTATGTKLFEAGEVLRILRGTEEYERSGRPGDEQDLGKRLKDLKHAVRQEFATIQLPRTIKPRLVCWMEMRKGE